MYYPEAFKGQQTATTVQSATGPVFNYPHDPAAQPTTPANVNAARTNAFYGVFTVKRFSV